MSTEVRATSDGFTIGKWRYYRFYETWIFKGEKKLPRFNPTPYKDTQLSEHQQECVEEIMQSLGDE